MIESVCLQTCALNSKKHQNQSAQTKVYTSMYLALEIHYRKFNYP